MAVNFPSLALVDGFAVLSIANESFLALAGEGTREVHAVRIRRAVVLASGTFVDVLTNISNLDKALLAHALIATIGVDAGSVDITDSQTLSTLIDVGTDKTVTTITRFALATVSSAFREMNAIGITRTVVGSIQALVDIENFNLSSLSTKRLQVRITTEIGSIRNIVQSRSLSSHVPRNINGNIDLTGARVLDGPTRFLVVGSSFATDLVVERRLQSEGERDVNLSLGGHSLLVAERSPLPSGTRGISRRTRTLVTNTFAVVVDHPRFATMMNNLGLAGVRVQNAASTRVDNHSVTGESSNFWFRLTVFTED